MRVLRVLGRVSVVLSVLVFGAVHVAGAQQPTPAPMGEIVLWGEMTPVEARLVDTRVDGVTVDGAHAGEGPLVGGDVRRFDVHGRGGIMADATDVYVNVVAVNPAANGWLRVFACDQDEPPISTVNFAAGTTIANSSIVSVIGGSLCVRASTATHLVVDVTGFFTDGLAWTPRRVIDTRPGAVIEDEELWGMAGEIDGRLEGGRVYYSWLSTSTPGGQLIANVTVTGSTEPGWLRIGSCAGSKWWPDAVRPTSSTLNFGAGQTVGNLAVISGQCVEASTDVELIVDALGAPPHFDIVLPDDYRVGWVSDWSDDVDGLRLVDTRTTERLRAGTTAFDIAPLDDAPMVAEPESVVNHPLGVRVINLAVVDPSAAGYLTVYGCDSDDDPPPSVATMNFQANANLAHLVLVTVDGHERVCVYTTAGTDLVIDGVAAAPTDNHPLPLLSMVHGSLR